MPASRLSLTRGLTAPAALLAAALAGACAGLPAPAEETVPVPGTTRFGSHRLVSGQVVAHRGALAGPSTSAVIGTDGSFTLHLPKGVYFITSTGKAAGSRETLWSFWSQNPLNLFGPVREPVVLRHAPLPAAPVASPADGVRGRVTADGAPVAGASVAAYLDDREAFHGPPFALSAPTGDDGAFELPVPAGTYYLVARVKPSGSGFEGPLLKGDLTGYYARNPVTVRGGGGLVLDIPLVQVLRPTGTGSRSPGSAIVIQGTITLESGAPAEGVRVCVYESGQTLGRPLFVSSPSDREGRYILEASREGRFFLAARSVLGRPPEGGELMGIYRGSEDSSVILRWGDRLDGIDFTVREMW